MDYFILLLSSGLRVADIVFFLKNEKEIIHNDEILVYKVAKITKTKRAFYVFLTKRFEVDLDILSNLGYEYYIQMSKRHRLVKAKYIRKYVATKLFSLGLSSEIVDFIQGRTPTSILTRHYLNLLSLAIREYRKYADWLGDFLAS